MKFIISGCGRVGSFVATTLFEQGHDVTIIDKNENSFMRLKNTYKGKKIIGIATDKKILLKAGIQKADSVIAVTSGDNTNIIVSRIAKSIYGIDNVVARIYDPNRATVYGKLGIPVVPTAKISANEILRHILTTTSNSKYEDSTGKIVLNNFKYSDKWIGYKIFTINEMIEYGNIAYINRSNQAFIPTNKTILQDLDEITLMYEKSQQRKIVNILKKEPKNE